MRQTSPQSKACDYSSIEAKSPSVNAFSSFHEGMRAGSRIGSKENAPGDGGVMPSAGTMEGVLLLWEHRARFEPQAGFVLWTCAVVRDAGELGKRGVGCP